MNKDLAHRIVNLSENVKQLKTAQLAYGGQYKLYPQQIIHEFTANYVPTSGGATYMAMFEFSDDSPFVLFGIQDATVYRNGTQVAWSGLLDYYGTEYEKTSDGLGINLELGWYVGTTEKMGNELVLTTLVPSTYTANSVIRIVINAYTTLPGFYDKTGETHYG